MSLAEQIQRVDGSQNDILKKVLGAFGVTVGENKIDRLAALAKLAPLLKENSILSSDTRALYNLGTDAVPDDVLKKLTEAAFIKSEIKTTSIRLDKFADDDIFEIDGVRFRVLSTSYNQDGSSGVLIQVLGLEQLTEWDNSQSTSYQNSALDTLLTGEVFNSLPNSVKSNAINASIRIYPGGHYDGNTILISRKIFAPAIGWFENAGFSDGHYIRNIQGVPGEPQTLGWSRTPAGNASYAYYNLNSDISIVTSFAQAKDSKQGLFACLLLPRDFIVKQETITKDVLYNMLTKKPVGLMLETGSYVGTGKYGEDNPNSLTFEFAPKLLFITNRRISGDFYGSASIDGNPMDCSILTTNYTNGLGFASKPESNILSGYAKKSFDGKTITWYHRRDANSQQNGSGYVYYYLAIG